MSSTTEKIYNSLKRNSSSTKPTSMNMEDIIKRSYELGLEFARRTQKKPIAKLNEGGIFTKDKEIDFSMYRSDGTIKSAVGWKGPIKNNITGSTMTELSIGAPGSEEGFYPLINPYMTDEQIEFIKDINLEGNAKVLGETSEGRALRATARRHYEESLEKGVTPFVSYTSNLDEAKKADEAMKKDLIRQQNTKEANVPKLQEGGSIADPFKTDFNYDDTINSINENLSQRGVPTVDLRVIANTVSEFLKDGGMASKMYSVTSGEISMEELRAKRDDMFNSLVSVSQFESSLGNAKKDKNGVIDHGNSNTTGMFGIQKRTLDTLHNNGTLDKDITWEMISTNPELANSVGALNVLQISSRAYNRTETFPTPMQSVLLNRAGVNGSLTNNVYDKEKGMSTFTPKEIQNYEDTNTFMNEIGIGN